MYFHARLPTVWSAGFMDIVSVTLAGTALEDVIVAEFSAAFTWLCEPSMVMLVLFCAPAASVEPFKESARFPPVDDRTARTVSPLV